MRMGLLKAVQEIAEVSSDVKQLVNIQDECGNTLALIATRRQDLTALQWLHENGADFTIGDYQNRTPESVSKHDGNEVIIHYIKTQEVLKQPPVKKSDKPIKSKSLSEILREERTRLLNQKKIRDNNRKGRWDTGTGP